MKRRFTVTALAAMAAMAVTAGSASADSIAPATYTATVAVGEAVTIHKTVTVTKQATAPVDIFFLTDTTGSMGGTINAVKSGFASVVTSLGGVASDVAFGVGDYKDVGDVYVYNETQDITTNTALAQTALNSLFASGGGDAPEANLQGLNNVATGAAWRAGSERFVVWAGDVYGHDPSGAITEAIATAALVNAGATVIAADVGSLDATGQATRIAAATGGSVLSGISAATIVTAITNALTAAIGTYSSVTLQVVGLPAGVSATFTPLAGYTGSFTRAADAFYGFDVTFTGLAAGIYDFSINALVDGKVIATERDHIEVVPEPGTMALLGLGMGVTAIARRRRASKQVAA